MGAFLLLLLGDLPGISYSAGTHPVFPRLHFSKFPPSQYLSLSPSNELPGEPWSRSPTQQQTDSAAETCGFFPFNTISSNMGFFWGGGVINHYFIAASTFHRSQQDDSILRFINYEKVLLTTMF